MDWSVMKKVGPGDAIRALAAHFEAFAFTRHAHDHYVIGLIGDGRQSFELAAEHYVTTPGQLMLINPGEAHTGRAAARGGFSYLALYPDRQDLLRFQEDSDLQPQARFRFRNTLVEDPALHQRLWTFSRSGDADPLTQETGFVWALRELLKRHGTCDSRRTGPAQARQELRRTQSYLHAHLGERITLGELSRVAGLSPYHLSRLFTGTYGMPPHKYLEGLRVREAQLLLEGGTPIVEAALAVGFSSQSHLNRSFKRILGITPAGYVP